jgi:toxin ParE1/3/4
MTARWTPTALRDLEALNTFAGTLVERILAGIRSLERHPEMGRAGRVAGTRELVAAPYVVAYRLKSERVEVLAVIHGARKWPGAL